MAGERTAKLTLRAGWSWNDSIRGNQTRSVDLCLAGVWVTLQRGGSAGQFAVPDPDDGAGRDFVKQGLGNLRGVLQQVIAQRGLNYTVSAVRDAGDDPTNGGLSFDGSPAWPLAEFDVEATAYSPALDLDFRTDSAYGGWTVVRNLTTLQPLLLLGSTSPATIYGSATGGATVQASGGNRPPLSYQWADQATGGTNVRTGLVGPGTYRCTVTDADRVSAYLDLVVGSDPRLEVEAATTDSSLALTIRGGVPPYAIAWADGPTTATRTGLAPGTYRARVTDSRGATRDVVVELVTQPYYWSGNAITLALDAGSAYRADPTTKPNLSFLCEVWVERDYDAGTFTQAGPTLEQPADADGRTLFQVQALLDAFLDYHVPDPGLTAPERATPLFRRFYLRHAERFGTPPVPEPVTTLEHHFVLRGGLDFYQAAARTWFAYQARVKPFLTWEPVEKWVLADQPEFLYFQVPPGTDACQLYVQVALAPSSSGQAITVPPLRWPLTGARPYEVFCLPAGYAQLGLGDLLARSSAPVVSWTVQVVDLQDVPLSETRQYRLLPRRYPQRRYLLFATSLGGMATYAALGEPLLDAEVKGEEATRALLPGYDPLAGDAQVLRRTLTPTVKLASGARTPAQLLASQDVLRSPRVLLLHPAGPRWLAGFLKAKTVPLLVGRQVTPTQELEFLLPTETFYTPDLPTA